MEWQKRQQSPISSPIQVPDPTHSCIWRGVLDCHSWGGENIGNFPGEMFAVNTECPTYGPGPQHRDDEETASQVKSSQVKSSILHCVNSGRISCFDHVVMRPVGSVVKTAYSKDFKGTRRRGRPKKKWIDCIRDTVGVPILTAERMAMRCQRLQT